MKQETLTIEQAADRVGKTPKTVWKWIKIGLPAGAKRVRLGAHKIGREWHTTQEAIDEFFRRLTESALQTSA